MTPHPATFLLLICGSKKSAVTVTALANSSAGMSYFCARLPLPLRFIKAVPLRSTVCRVTLRLWVEEFPNRIGPVTSRPICSVRRPPGRLPSPTEFTPTMTTTCSPVTQQFSTRKYTFWVSSVALPSEFSLVTRVIVALGHASPFLLQILRRRSTFLFFYASRSVCWSCDVLVKECKNTSCSYSDMFFLTTAVNRFFSTQQIILEF